MISIFNIFMPTTDLYTVECLARRDTFSLSKLTEVSKAVLKKNESPAPPSKTRCIATKYPPIQIVPYAEKKIIRAFVKDKTSELGLPHCCCKFNPDENGFMVQASDKEFRIFVNCLYLVVEKDIEFFLSVENPKHVVSIKEFIASKKADVLEEAARDFIVWYNDVSKAGVGTVRATPNNILLAKEILVLGHLKTLSKVKQFLLVHEVSHIFEHVSTKPLKSFHPDAFSFIKEHQHSEIQADLTAAREIGHDLAAEYFEWRSFIAYQPSSTAPHPTDTDRAKVIRIDRDTLAAKKISLPFPSVPQSKTAVSPPSDISSSSSSSSSSVVSSNCDSIGSGSGHRASASTTLLSQFIF